MGQAPGSEAQVHAAAQEEMTWISVKEKLPETSGIVLYATGSGHVSTCQYVRQLNESYPEAGFRYTGNNRIIHEITHWQPMPSPP